jgi:hypothetical protein
VAGNPNAASALATAMSIDVVPPPVPTVNSLVTKNPTPTITGTVATALGAGDTLKVTVNGLTYTVVPVPTAWSLNLATATPDTGTFSPLPGNPTPYQIVARTQDDAGNVEIAAGSLTIDTVAPAVISVTSPDASIAYGVGDVITIDVTFSEPVTLSPVSGKPTLQLNAGPGARADYSGGSGTSVLKFSYTVLAGQSTSGLDYASSAALLLNGSTIRDQAENDAVLTLAAPGTAGSLGDASGIVIETTAPTAAITSSSATLKKGQTATITVTFSEPPVAVPGLVFTPAGASSASSPMALVPGADPKVFTAVFTPAANFEGAVSFSIPGTYTDVAGNPGSPASLANAIDIDTKSPTVVITTDLAPGASLTADQTVTVTFTWSERVTFAPGGVSITPAGNLTLLPSSWTDVNGMGTTYTAVYTPKANFEGSATIALLAGAATDVVGNASDAGLPVSITIDTKSPSVTISATPISLASGGQSLVTIDFSSMPVGFDANDVVVTPLGTAQGSFNGTLAEVPGDPTRWTGTWSASGGAGSVMFRVNAEAFTDVEGNPNASGDDVTILVDTIAPRVLSVSAPTGIYNAGDEIVISVVFSEELPSIDSVPPLGLKLGTGGTATWFDTAADGRTQLFRYNVTSGHNASPLDYLAAGSLIGGPVTDAVGNPANLALPTPGGAGSLASSNVVVDTTSPTIVSVKANKNGTFKAGGVMQIDVVFSERLPYTTATLPSMTLDLNSGGTATSWKLMSDQRTVRFQYTVLAGENATRLDFDTNGALNLVGTGDLLDAAGNVADLTLPTPGGAGSLAVNNQITIDTLGPVVVDVTSLTPSGTYKAGTTLRFQATFSEPVRTLTSPSLRLALGGTRYATVDSISDSTIVFKYVVQSGDAATALDYATTSALIGSLTDIAGNAANLVLPQPGATGSISDDQTIVIDTTAPQVAAISLLSPAGTYGPNSVVRFAITMSESVAVGSPKVLLNTTPARYADLVDSDGTTMIFEYRTSIGDRATVLNHASTAALTGAIADLAGNAAILALPAPVVQRSLGGPGVIAVDATIRALATNPILSSSPTGPVYGAPLTQIDLEFNVPVSGVTLAGIKLFFEGRSISLTGATITGSGTSYRLTLPRAATNLNGSYRLRIGGGASGIMADGATMSTATNLYWRKVAATT